MLRAGHGLMLAAISLLTIGVVMVSSAGLTVDPHHAVDLPQILFGRTAALAALAVAALFVASRVPVDRLYRIRGWLAPAPWLAVAIVVLLLAVHIPGVGREVNGARRWIDLGFVSFQPSEVAKWGTIFILACYAARRPEAMGRLTTGFLWPMGFVALVCGLIATEDLGTAVLIGMVAAVTLLAAGAKLWHAAVMAVPALVAFAAAVATSSYRLDRLRAWLDPYQDPQGIGYHIIQSLSTVAAGGVTGRGLGASVQKFGYLPEDTTDFIFAIICEELGLVGAAVVIFLYGGLLGCGWMIVRVVEQPFRRLMGLGILATIGLQALINISVVTGLAPTKGIALPLVSAGGTGWLLTAFSLGLIVSMGRAAPAGRMSDSPWPVTSSV